MTKTTPGAMKHTEGPWKHEVVRTSIGICHKIGPFAPSLTGKENYACIYDDCYSDKPRNEELKANARLIAASPAMLEALQALMDEYKQRMDGDYPGENLHQFQSAYKMARAAIAAATGEAEKP